MKQEIGKRILNIRKSMDMNKEQFSKLIGISPQYLGTIEAGVHGLSLDSFITLCENTNISADYILFGKENITDDALKTLFVGIDKSQINSAFNVLQSMAIFIKSREEVDYENL